MVDKRGVKDRRKENRRKTQTLIWSWNEKRGGGYTKPFRPLSTNDPGRRQSVRRECER